MPFRFGNDAFPVPFCFEVGVRVGGRHDAPASVGEPGAERIDDPVLVAGPGLNHGHEERADRTQVRLPVPAVQPAPGVGVEVAGANYREAELVRGDLGVAAGVVEGALLAAMDAADGHPVRFVEERDRLIVLALSVLHHELALRPVAVDGQLDAAPVSAGVAAQPVEAVLPLRDLTEILVAEVEDVCLVAFGSPTHGTASCQEPLTSRLLQVLGRVTQGAAVVLGRRLRFPCPVQRERDPGMAAILAMLGAV